MLFREVWSGSGRPQRLLRTPWGKGEEGFRRGEGMEEGWDAEHVGLLVSPPLARKLLLLSALYIGFHCKITFV